MLPFRQNGGTVPFKSEAQRDRARKMVKKGEITEEKFNEWNKGTPKRIPQRIHPKKDKK